MCYVSCVELNTDNDIITCMVSYLSLSHIPYVDLCLSMKKRNEWRKKYCQINAGLLDLVEVVETMLLMYMYMYSYGIKCPLINQTDIVQYHVFSKYAQLNSNHTFIDLFKCK